MFAFAEREESGDGSGGVVEKKNHTVLISQLFVFMLRLRSRDYSLVCVFPTGETSEETVAPTPQGRKGPWVWKRYVAETEALVVRWSQYFMSLGMEKSAPPSQQEAERVLGNY